MIIVLLWLFAIVGANLSIGYFGPEVSVINAFLLIGLGLTTRDHLHRKWEGKNLKLKMVLLIATGGLLSWLTQPGVGRIALASVFAFAVAEIIDAIVYHKTKSINKSNAVSGFVDSVLFPTLAFGGFPVLIILGQWLAKFAGGYFWSIGLRKRTWISLLAILGITTAQGQITSIDGFITDDGDRYVTATVFAPGEVEVFAFVDRYLDGAEVVYGEGAVYFNKSDFATTIQVEIGDAKFFDIDETLLGGVRWKGIELLIRSDENIQLTYVWFKRWGNIQFNGYVDMWGSDDIQVITQPQLWYYLQDWLAIGGEIFCQYDDKFDCKPAIGLKIFKTW